MRKFWISFISLFLGVVIGVGIWHGIAHEDNLKSIAKDAWAKIESVFVKNDGNDSQKPNEEKPDQPTPDKPSEEQINLDGLYYLDVDGDVTFVQIKGSKYGTINGHIKDSKIYLASNWESEVELEPLHTIEDDKYLHVFVTDQANGQEYKIAIYDKTTKKLYYDFSNGDQFPGETYEDQLLFEMVKFENFELHEQCSFNEIVYSCAPSCNDAGREIRQCLCGKTETVETSPALGHNYVNGVCTRCQEHDPNYVEETSLIDGLYYGVESDGSIKVFQIRDNKFVNFYGYTKNGDQSLIYLPQDWTTYIESGYSLTIEVNDTQIIAGITDYMEGYKDNEQLYEVFKNYFVYDKEANKMCVGKNKAVLTKIEECDILPYEEPRISIENDILHMSDMTSVGGTYNIYYQFMSGSYEGEYPDSYFEKQSYVAGNVTEFDLSLLVNRESVPMLKGCTYQIRVMFDTSDGFHIQGFDPVQYTVPNAIECEHNFEKITCSTTCISDGTEVEECSICGLKRYNSIPAYGHDYVDCICSRCGATNHTFDAGVCTSCNALDEEFYDNFCGYWFTETTGFDAEGFSKYYFLIEKDGDNYYFTRSGYKVEDGKIILYNNSTDYGSRQSFTFTASNYLGSTPLISGFTLTRQETTFNGCYDGSQLSVGDMIFIKTDKEIYLDGSSAPVTPM